MADCEFIENKH